MKQLKFKAYSHNYKMTMDVTCIDFRNILEGYVTFKGNEADVWDAVFDGKDYTLKQYTGLKIGKKEIYEGDIIQAENNDISFSDVVVFEKGCFMCHGFILFELLKTHKCKIL